MKRFGTARRSSAYAMAVVLLAALAARASDILPPDPKGRMLMEVVDTLERDMEELGKKRRALNGSRDQVETELAINQETIIAIDAELETMTETMQRLTRAIVRMREPDDLLLLFSSMRYHDLQVYRRVVSKLAVNVSGQLTTLVRSRRTLDKRQAALLAQQKDLSERRDRLLAETSEVEKTLDRKRKELQDRLSKIAAVESLFMPTAIAPGAGDAGAAAAGRPSAALTDAVDLGAFKDKKELQIPISPGRVIKAFDRTPAPPMGTEKMVRGWILVPFFSGKKKEATESAYVRAPAAGVVAFVGDVPGFGYTMILDHGHGFFTVYSNLFKVNPLKGEAVQQDQLMAVVRSPAPGRDLPYLYFELRENRMAVDPRPWFKLRSVESGEGK